MTEQIVREFLLVGEKEVSLVRGLAEEHGVVIEENPQKHIDLVTVASVISLTLVGSTATVSKLRNLVEQFRGGQVIDLRADARQTFYRTTDLMYGLVAILAADGTVKIEVHEPNSMFAQTVDALAAALTGLQGAGTQQIATRITEQLSASDATVSATPDAGP